jgi:hypothetical protein
MSLKKLVIGAAVTMALWTAALYANRPIIYCGCVCTSVDQYGKCTTVQCYCVT